MYYDIWHYDRLWLPIFVLIPFIKMTDPPSDFAEVEVSRICTTGVGLKSPVG